MLRQLILTSILFLITAGSAEAAVTWNVTVSDSTGAYGSLYSTIIEHCRLAGETWSNHIITAANASIEVEVDLKQVPSNRGGGGSVTHFFLEN